MPEPGFDLLLIIREPKLLTARLSLRHPNSTAQADSALGKALISMRGTCGRWLHEQVLTDPQGKDRALLTGLAVTYPELLSALLSVLFAAQTG